MIPTPEYLSEGISEALINSLTELQQLRVIARSTAFQYKGKDVDPRRVGRELQVAVVLTGKVRQMQDALSVQVDLVDAVHRRAALGLSIRSQDCGLGCSQTGNCARGHSEAEAEIVQRRAAAASQARQHQCGGLSVLPARPLFWNKRTPDGIKQAIEQFQQGYSSATLILLSATPAWRDSYIGLTFYDFAAPHETMPKAKNRH